MSIVITIPKILVEKLGQSGAEALAETMNKVQQAHSESAIVVCETRFERRLVEVEERLRREILQTREELRIELARTRADMIKWMFIFWLGQMTLMFTFFKPNF